MVMNYLRKIINSKDIESIVELPEELKNKKVELLILPVSEDEENESKFDPEEYCGLLNLEEEKIKEGLSEIRSDWKRY